MDTSKIFPVIRSNNEIEEIDKILEDFVDANIDHNHP